MSLASCRVGQFCISFIFSSSIFILLDPIITSKNPTFLIFHLYFSSFTYKLFSANHFTTSFTILSCSSFVSVSIVMSSIKLAIFPVLIRSHKSLFIMVWNIAGEFVSLKNITISSNNPFRVVNAAFYLSPSFIYILL